MIDTVVLSLGETEFEITNSEAFRPLSRLTKSSSNSGYAVYRHSPATYPSPKGYQPRLTASKRPYKGAYQTMLKIEFSAPKLILGNNFEELSDSDFPRLIENLNGKLKSMGIRTSESTLMQAKASAVHFSKNFLLTDGATPSYFIREIQTADAHGRLDLNLTKYRNHGLAYSMHANSYEIVFYDKIADLTQAKISEKRSIEKDYKNQDASGIPGNLNVPLEVLRMEVRLSKRSKVRQLIPQFAPENPLTFQGIFSENISGAILRHFMEKIIQSRNELAFGESSALRSLIVALRLQNPRISPAKILQHIGLFSLSKEMHPREFRNYFPKSDRRTLKQIEAAARRVGFKPRRFDPLRQLMNSLDQYSPVRRDQLRPEQSLTLQNRITNSEAKL